MQRDIATGRSADRPPPGAASSSGTADPGPRGFWAFLPGFVGARLTEALRRAGHAVIGIDLREGAPAGDIQAHVDLPASTLSHHLKRLSDAGVLSSRSEGTFLFYTADYPALRGLTDYLWEDCCKRGGKASCC